MLKKTAFETHFADQAGKMFSYVNPAPLIEPQMLAISQYSNQFDGLRSAKLFSPEQAQFWSGHFDSTVKPIALVYSGHQFGVWAGQLGDGRAMTLGCLIDLQGQTHEVQLKGAGQTPYSRSADGRAVLRSSIREFLCSEAMEGLGIPTTRVLTLTGAKTAVIRETVESAAVVSRVAPSFIRFGSFEHYYYLQQPEQVKELADFVIDQYYPQCRSSTNPYADFLQHITQANARLVAQWQAVGFCHGVLNTDNMSILGLTLDYGPFGFMEAFDAAYVCNHSDQQGRYSYQNQPGIVQWNCFALGQTLVPLIGSAEKTKEVLGQFKTNYDEAMRGLWMAKLGLNTETNETIAVAADNRTQANSVRVEYSTSAELIYALFNLMQANHCDWTLWFRTLSQFNEADTSTDHLLLDLCIDRAQCQAWLDSYRIFLLSHGNNHAVRAPKMNRVNPKYVLRNYLAQQAIAKAEAGDFSEIKTLQSLLARPFDEQPELDRYAALPPDWAKDLEVSCSS
jgi:serine/tyrosine/threonine adenylyltransferase